jgi:hypothetical protein
MTSFINQHRDVYGVEPIYTVLPIAPSTYYEQKAREADPSRLPPRAQRDAFLCERIERVWLENRGVYGAEGVVSTSARGLCSGAVYRQAVDEASGAYGCRSWAQVQNHDPRRGGSPAE